MVLFGNALGAAFGILGSSWLLGEGHREEKGVRRSRGLYILRDTSFPASSVMGTLSDLSWEHTDPWSPGSLPITPTPRQ